METKIRLIEAEKIEDVWRKLAWLLLQCGGLARIYVKLIFIGFWYFIFDSNGGGGGQKQNGLKDHIIPRSMIP